MALEAEALGFDSLWAVEHHFDDYTMCPDPVQFLTCGRSDQPHPAWYRSHRVAVARPDASAADTSHCSTTCRAVA